MWWWLSCGGGCHVVVIVMWWWFSCKIKHGNGDRCWLYRACWWLSCGGGCHVVLIVIGTGCHVVVEVIGNDCPGSGWLLTLSSQLENLTKTHIIITFVNTKCDSTHAIKSEAKPEFALTSKHRSAMKTAMKSVMVITEGDLGTILRRRTIVSRKSIHGKVGVGWLRTDP